MFTRHGYARCMNDMGLDVACPEPARQPKAVPTGLESDSDACDPVSCLLCFLAPSMQQLQQCSLVDGALLQRLTLDARYDARNEPARLAHVHPRDYRAVRFVVGEGSAPVIQLLHGALHRFASAPVDTTSSPLPHSISVGRSAPAGHLDPRSESTASPRSMAARYRFAPLRTRAVFRASAA